MKVIRVLAVVAVLALLLSLAVIERRRAGAAASTPRSLAAAGSALPAAARKVHDFPRHRNIQATPFEQGAAADPSAPPHAFDAYMSRCAAVREKWAKTKVSLNFSDTTLVNVLAEFLGTYGLEVLLDAGIDGNDCTVTFKVEELAADQAIDLIAKMADMQFVISESGEAWLVRKGEGAKHQPPYVADLEAMLRIARLVRADLVETPPNPEEAALRERLNKEYLDVDMSDSSAYDVLDHIQEHAKMNIVISAVLRKEWKTVPLLTVHSKGGTLARVFDAYCEAGGFAWGLEQGVVLITSAEELQRIADRKAQISEEKRLRREAEAALLAQRVFIGGENLAIRDVAEMLGQALSVPVVVDPQTWHRAARFGFPKEERTAREIVSALKQGAPLIVAFRDGTLWFLSPDESE